MFKISPITNLDGAPLYSEQHHGHVAEVLFDGCFRHAAGEQRDQGLDVVNAFTQDQYESHGGVRVWPL